MTEVIAAAIVALAALTAAALTADFGRRRHLSLIKAEAETLNAIPGSVGQREVLALTLSENLMRYAERRQPKTEADGRTHLRFFIGMAVYSSSVISFYFADSEGGSSRLSVSLFVLTAVLLISGAVLFYSPMRLIIRTYFKKVRQRRKAREVEEEEEVEVREG